MLKECTCFDSYGEVEVFWKNKILVTTKKAVIREFYSPSFASEYATTLNVNSFLSVVADEKRIVAVGSS
ncbi:hypothetical protein [Archaeoglobus sp.]